MTTYINNPNVQMVDDYIEAKPFFYPQVVKNAGNFIHPLKYRKQTEVQLHSVLARAAVTKVSPSEAFPAASESDLKAMLRSAQWVTNSLAFDHDEWEDLQAGNPQVLQDSKERIDAIQFDRAYTMRNIFVGYGLTLTGKEYNVLENWIPWFQLKATGSASIADPADMTGKVTTIDGDSGTSGTMLDMDTVLYSSDGTGQTVDFVENTFGPIKDAFIEFEDSENGKRMTDPNEIVGNTTQYTLLMNKQAIRWLKSAKQYDGEKIDLAAPRIMEEMKNENLKVLPCDLFSASKTEDGYIEFAMISDFKNNFKIGTCNAAKWTDWQETEGLTRKHIRGYSGRYIPFTHPYFDGSNWYKAVAFGKFKYRNDST